MNNKQIEFTIKTAENTTTSVCRLKTFRFHLIQNFHIVFYSCYVFSLGCVCSNRYHVSESCMHALKPTNIIHLHDTHTHPTPHNNAYTRTRWHVSQRCTRWQSEYLRFSRCGHDIHRPTNEIRCLRGESFVLRDNRKTNMKIYQQTVSLWEMLKPRVNIQIYICERRCNALNFMVFQMKSENARQ